MDQYNKNKIAFNKGFLFILLLLGVLGTFCSQKQTINNSTIAQINIHTGAYERDHVPIHVSLEGMNFPFYDSSFVLIETTNGGEKEVPCQMESEYSNQLWWILDGITPKNTTRTYELRSAAKERIVTPFMNYSRNQNFMVLKKEKKPVLSYRYAPGPSPDGGFDRYARNAYIHPLYTPSGNVLSRIEPITDHDHHYGIWNPWKKVRFNGRTVDFFGLDNSNPPGEGNVRFSEFVSEVSGPVYSGFQALHRHVDMSVDTNIMHELWDIRAWNVMINNQEVFLWDLTTTLNCATDKPVMLDQYRYGGGIAFRATKDWKGDNTRVLTSEGKIRKDADGTKARWCIIWANVEGETPSGILFMSNPSNREYPEPMRVWPSNSNDGRGDVFFEFCPIRHNSWKLAPGKLYTLKYRMMVFDGKFPDRKEAEEVWNDFAHPPEVVVKVEK